ncbi:MAG: 3D domain-containing protein [Eubacterium sp.]|nr:3D domain-containing protein [Eubacterium sp.]
MKKIIILLLIFCIGISSDAAIKTRWTTINVEEKRYLGEFKITHYCPCSRCCGVGGGKITASGTRPTAGRTVGVNPRLIPYGTKLQIGKTKGYVAEDTGGGIGWYHLDVFCNSHQEALQKGVHHKKVYAITYKKVKVKMVLNKAKAIKIKNKMKTYLEVK